MTPKLVYSILVFVQQVEQTIIISMLNITQDYNSHNFSVILD